MSGPGDPLALPPGERTTMRKSTFTIVLASSLVTLAPSLGADRAFAQTAFSVSAHIGDFHVAVANYYQVPEREVIVIRERRIPDDEIPVALFIARHAGVPWTRVVDMCRPAMTDLYERLPLAIRVEPVNRSKHRISGR